MISLKQNKTKKNTKDGISPETHGSVGDGEWTEHDLYIVVEAYHVGFFNLDSNCHTYLAAMMAITY